MKKQKILALTGAIAVLFFAAATAQKTEGRKKRNPDRQSPQGRRPLFPGNRRRRDSSSAPGRSPSTPRRESSSREGSRTKPARS